ncbi:MAG: hypothetical protein H6923_08315 [Alphaproteobacteria bacterium]|nr:hypothetical protein [Alphaproteobacteria bacterium]
MIRILNMAALALVAALAFALYSAKYEMRTSEAHLASLERRAAEAEDSLRVLKAEWSLQNQPDRLARLAQKFLDLEPLAAPQVVSLDSLPLADAFAPVAPGAGPAAKTARSLLVAAAGPTIRMPLDKPGADVEVLWRR